MIDPWRCWCGHGFKTGWCGKRAEKHRDWHARHHDGDFLPNGSKEKETRSWTCMRALSGARDHWTCRSCGRNKLTDNVEVEVHHIISRMMGGTDHMHNLITLCEGCHDHTKRGNYSGNPTNNRKLTDF